MQRINKKRKKLKQRAIAVNKRAAANSSAEEALNTAVKEHIKKVYKVATSAVEEFNEAQSQVKSLVDIREGLLARNKTLQDQVYQLSKENKTLRSRWLHIRIDCYSEPPNSPPSSWIE